MTVVPFVRPHVSYSEWMLWRQCQQRWKLDFVDGHRSKVVGVHMDFGTVIHGTIERLRCRRPDPALTIDDHVRSFRSSFEALYNEHRPLYRDPVPTMEFFLEAGETILRRFHECRELAEAEVVYNEHELFEPIDRSDVSLNFKGFIDMVIKTKDARGKTILYVCDFKTCSWGWGRDKRQDKDLHFQILLYKHFLCKKFDLDPKLVRTAFVLLKKRPRKDDSPVEFLPISAGPVSVQRALDELDADIGSMNRAVTTGTFVKNRNACINDFGERCPHSGTDRCPE